MALSEKHRAEIYKSLSPIVGEDSMDAWLSNYPIREMDEPATKDFVRAEISATKGELQAEIAATRGELRAEIAQVSERLSTQMSNGFEQLRQELRGEMRHQLFWILGALLLVVSVVLQKGF